MNILCGVQYSHWVWNPRTSPYPHPSPAYQAITWACNLGFLDKLCDIISVPGDPLPLDMIYPTLVEGLVPGRDSRATWSTNPRSASR